MSESIPTRSEKEPPRKEHIISLAMELFKNGETFPFSGIEPEAYKKLSDDIARDEEDSGYTTAMFRELLERFEREGMKVVLGKNPQSGNVFVLPTQSDNVEMDSISPKHLQVSGGMNEKLQKLISLVRG